MGERKRPSVIRENNENLFRDYYNKPSWWFSFRYDTQVKRKTVLYLLRHAGVRMKNLRVLEIGFGSGAVLFSFDRSCEIYGVELSSSAKKLAEEKAVEKRYGGYEFHLEEAESLKFPDGWFDLVIASHLLEHVENDGRLLSEIRRVLRSDGVAVFLIPINERYEDPNHVRRYTSEGFLALLERHGFDKVLNKIENELLFYIVEKFYFEEYNKRWRVTGPLIAALFNFPTSILPFSAYRLIDRLFMLFGFRPRQFGCIVRGRTE